MLMGLKERCLSVQQLPYTGSRPVWRYPNSACRIDCQRSYEAHSVTVTQLWDDPGTFWRCQGTIWSWRAAMLYPYSQLQKADPRVGALTALNREEKERQQKDFYKEK
jgi:hypothetical protein